MHRILTGLLLATIINSSLHPAQPKKPKKKDAVVLSSAKRIALYAAITKEVLEDLSSKEPAQLHDTYRSIKQHPSNFYLGIIDTYKEQGFLVNPRILASVTNTVMSHMHTKLAAAYGPDFDKEKSMWESVKVFFTCRSKAKKS